MLLERTQDMIHCVTAHWKIYCCSA